MQTLITGNPFALMMDPEAVLQAVERSERLSTLKSKIYRPLDKPLIPKVMDFHTGTTDFDHAIEATEEAESGFEPLV
jgi:hypothetical protein